MKVFFGIIKVYRSKIGKLGEIHPTFLRFQLLGPLCTFMISYLTRKTRQIDVMSTKKTIMNWRVSDSTWTLFTFFAMIVAFSLEKSKQWFVLMLWRIFLSFFFKFTWRTRTTTSKSTFSILLPCYSTALHHHPNEHQIEFYLKSWKFSWYNAILRFIENSFVTKNFAKIFHIFVFDFFTIFSLNSQNSPDVVT